jgi:hypothetical protein
MPSKNDYQDLTLAQAVRQLAEHHYDHRTRHLSSDEYQLLLRAADAINREVPLATAFS